MTTRSPTRTISRRAFVGGASAVGVGMASGSGPSLGLLPPEAFGATPEPGEAAWRQLSKALSGPVVRPSDFDFAKFFAIHNLRYKNTRPQGIAFCQSREDVAHAIAWCRENNIPLVARAGGHSYGGYSTTTGLIIDVSRIDTIDYDSSSGIVTVGGGVRNRALYETLQAAGVSTTHGRCPAVGAAGYVLGGGIGFDDRKQGVASDHLVAGEMVTANGEVLQLSATENPDLFWACRGGGGGNFGINTAFSLQTFPVDRLTTFRLKWRGGEPKPERVFEQILQTLSDAPDGFGSEYNLHAVTDEQQKSGKDVEVVLFGQLYGTKKQLLDLLDPIYAVAVPQEHSILDADYWSAQPLIEEHSAPVSFALHSMFVPKPLGADQIGVVFEWLRKWPGTSKEALFSGHQTGGAMNKRAADSTAFVHRDSAWLMVTEVDWEPLEPQPMIAANLDWLGQFFEAVRPFSNGGCYQNFIDPALKDWQQAYYGRNLPRLRRVKRAVDPEMVFTFPQAIPPA